MKDSVEIYNISMIIADLIFLNIYKFGDIKRQ